MPIRFTCPNSQCAKTIVVKDEFAGRAGKCPGCATPVKVPAAMPAFEVVEDEPGPTPPPPPPKKKSAVVVVEDTERAPPPKPKPVVAVEEPEVWDVTEAVDDPPPKKAVAAAARSRDDDAAPAPPKKAALRKAAPPADYDDDILGRTQWYLREIDTLMKITRAGLFETVESKEPYALILDGTFKLFGFIAIDVAGLRPRFKFQLRRGDKHGPVLLTLERFVPRFDVPFKPKKPSRWEVRGPDDAVVGSITFSRGGFSVLKWLVKGQFFQNEVCVLDAAGQKAGKVVVDRGGMGQVTKMVVEDEDGVEYGGFGTQTGKKAKELMDEVKQTGKFKVQFSFSVGGKGEEEQWKGVYGRVNPDRAGDPYARIMILAITILLENLSGEAFLGVKSREK